MKKGGGERRKKIRDGVSKRFPNLHKGILIRLNKKKTPNLTSKTPFIN
jgi:hypothetical protein